MWRNYNDERVTKVTDVSEIFDAPSGDRPPTPYFLVYVKEELKEDLVNPVCRDVTEVPPSEPNDVTMEDYDPIELNAQVENDYAAFYPSTIDTTQSGRSIPTGRVAWNDSHHELPAIV